MRLHKQGDDGPTMSRRDRLRRVVILCRNFARNLAYYRTGQLAEHAPLLDPKCPRMSFWRITNGNCIDICVLEWCKLFADKNGKNHWRKIVSEPAVFKARLLSDLGLEEERFSREIEEVKLYRDKFLAHLDSELTMNIPRLDVAKESAWFYHAYIVAHETQAGDLAGLPLELDAGYAESESEARVIYQQAVRSESRDRLGDS